MEGLLRSLWASLCQFLYQILAWLYELFINVSRVEILTTDNIKPIYQRITMILTIVMVFYVTFEAVKYVVQPDNFTDKEKGGGKLVSKMIIVVVLIAFVPTFFSAAYKFQNIIFDNQVFSKVILGKQGVDTNQFGRVFSANLLGMFYYVDEYKWDEKTLKEESNCEDIPCATIVNANLSNLIEYGELPLMQVGLNEGDELTDEGTGDVFQYYIHFDGLFAVLVGGFVCYMLVLYCIDIGVRVVQLTFLQIIAPIPIIGYLSPKKDGIFQKWVKQCTATYLDLFIRTGIIYFGLLICQVVSEAFATETLFNNIPGDTSTTMKVFIYIALILGILMFLSKAPKLLGELFPKTGVASGNFGLKAKDRIDSIPTVAARTAGAVLGSTRAIGGMVGRAASRAIRNRANKDTRAQSRAAAATAQNNMNENKKEREANQNSKAARIQQKRDNSKALQKRIDDSKAKLTELGNAYNTAKKNGASQEVLNKQKELIKAASADYNKALQEKREMYQTPAAKAAKENYATNNKALINAKQELETARNTNNPTIIAAAQAKVDEAQIKFDKAKTEYMEELRQDQVGDGKQIASLIDKKQEDIKQEEAIKTAERELKEAQATNDTAKIQEAEVKLNELQQQHMQSQTEIKDIAQQSKAAREKIIDNYTTAQTQDEVIAAEIKQKDEELQQEYEKYQEQYEEAKATLEQNRYRSVVLGGIEGAIKGGITGAWTGAHATNIKEVFTKTGEGWKKDADAIRKENAYVDNGGATGINGVIDRTTAKIEKAIGYDTAYERRMLESKKFDAPIKALDAKMVLTKDAISTIGSGEDRLKSKVSELKAPVAGRKIATGFKDAAGNDIFADTAGCNNIGDLTRKYDALAATAKAEADTAAKSAEELAMEAARETDPTEKTNKEKLAEAAKEKAREKAIVARNAEHQADQVKKNAAKDVYTQILQHPNPASDKNLEQVAVEEIDKAKNSIALAAQDPNLRESIRKTLNKKFGPNRGEYLYQAFATGVITSFEDIDDIKGAIISTENEYGVQKKDLQEDKRRNETSARAEQEKAANDAAGNSGK